MVRQIEQLKSDPEALAEERDLFGDPEIDGEERRKAPTSVSFTRYGPVFIEIRVREPLSPLEAGNDGDFFRQLEDTPHKKTVWNVERLKGILRIQ